MQADPTPEGSRRVLTPEPEPEPGPESVLDPEQDARAALAEFVALHGPALRASGVPERYWGRLLHKLEHEVPVGAPCGEARGAGRSRGAGPRGALAAVPSAPPGWVALDFSTWEGVVSGPVPGREPLGARGGGGARRGCLAEWRWEGRRVPGRAWVRRARGESGAGVDGRRRSCTRPDI